MGCSVHSSAQLHRSSDAKPEWDTLYILPILNYWKILERLAKVNTHSEPDVSTMASLCEMVGLRIRRLETLELAGCYFCDGDKIMNFLIRYKRRSGRDLDSSETQMRLNYLH
jgi:hypothetical protein